MASKKEPHRGIPLDQLTKLQLFDQMVFHRRRAMYARAQQRKNAVIFVGKFGDAMRDRLPPGVTVDADLVVRFDDEYQQQEQWRGQIETIYSLLGDAILDRLPPDTTIDPATGTVMIDPDKRGW